MIGPTAAMVSPSSSLNVNAPDFTPSYSSTPQAYGHLAAAQPLPSVPSDEVMIGSGKYPSPVKIPGKNSVKDEVVIRNADSGKGIVLTSSLFLDVLTCQNYFLHKVMGLKGRRVHMIEELSDTVISFQRGSLYSLHQACLLFPHVCVCGF